MQVLKEVPEGLVSEASKKRGTIHSHPLKFITVGWLTPVMSIGAKATLTSEQLLNLQPKDTARRLADLLNPFWNDFKASTKDKTVKPNLFRVFRQQYTLVL